MWMCLQWHDVYTQASLELCQLWSKAAVISLVKAKPQRTWKPGVWPGGQVIRDAVSWLSYFKHKTVFPEWVRGLGLSIVTFAVPSWVDKRLWSFLTFISEHKIAIKVVFMSISWCLHCFTSAVSFITLDLLIKLDQIQKTYGLFPDGFIVDVWIVKITH